MRKRDKRVLIKEKQRQRSKSIQEPESLDKILADLKASREGA